MMTFLRVRTWSIVLRTYTCDHCLIVRSVTSTTCGPPFVLWRMLKAPAPVFLNPTYIDLLYLLYRALIERFRRPCYIFSINSYQCWCRQCSCAIIPLYVSHISISKYAAGIESVCHKVAPLWLWCHPEKETKLSWFYRKRCFIVDHQPLDFETFLHVCWIEVGECSLGAQLEQPVPSLLWCLKD